MKMKKTTLLCMVLGLAFVSCSLFGPKTGDLEGFEIYFSTDPANLKALPSSRALPSSLARTTHFPNSGALGITKFWFPTAETYDTIKTKGSLSDGIIPLTDADLVGSYYKAIDRSPDNPLVLDSASTDPYIPDLELPYGATYKGIIIEYAFLQVEMDDYKLRYYSQDSNEDNKDYKAGDVLIDLNNDAGGWKFLYNKREFTFDFNYKDHQTPNNNYERIVEVSCDIQLYLSDTRMPTQIGVQKSYYENWKYQGGLTGESPQYIYDFLSTKDSARLADYESDSNGIYPDEKLVQIFRLNPDVPMDSSGNSFQADKGEDTFLRNTGNKKGPSDTTTLIVDYGPNASLEDPYTIETFPEDANEAKMYKMELVYSLGNSDHGTDGLTIQVPVDGWNENDTPSPAWNELSVFTNMLSIGPSCGGIGARFGWLDFNDVWQGDFSADAGK